MDNLISVSFSTKPDYLLQLLDKTRNYFDDSLIHRGFQDETELLEYLKKSQSKENIQYIILDLEESDNTTLQFMEDVDQFTPNTVKFIISGSTQLLNIQKQINNLDSIHFLNRSCSDDDFEIAFNTAKNYYSNLKIIRNYKSELSSFPKKIEDKLTTKLKELIDSNLAKEKLFSIIAHDLRSPFTALLGISEILINEWDELTDKEKLNLVQGLKSSSENTFKLLENLLTWAKTQGEKIEAIPEPVQINKIIDSVVEFSKNCAAKKCIKIENKISEDIQVLVDKNMISTVFRNLISNAIQHIPHGREVAITAEAEKEFCTFCIADNGEGIDQSHIIDHFKYNNTVKLNGNRKDFKGLGLLLCKDFIECNGGQIWLKTQKGKGSKIYFSVPF